MVGAPAQAAGSSTPAQVASTQSQNTPDTGGQGADMALDKTATILLSAMTTTPGGTRTFDFQLAVAAGATGTQAKEFSSGFVVAGGLVVNAPSDMVFVQPTTAQSLELRSAIQAQANCVGRSQIWNDVWGKHIEVNTCTVQKMLGILAIGGSVETLIGIIAASMEIPVAGWVAGAAAAFIGIGAGAIIYCNADGTGVTLHFTGVPWCGAQRL